MIKDIIQGPPSLKAIALWLGTTPFWYIKLYLFSPWIVEQNDDFLKFSICIANSVISGALLSFAISFKLRIDSDKSMAASGLSLFFLIIWSSTLIFISYTSSIYFHLILTFWGMIVTYHLPIICYYIYISYTSELKPDEKSVDGNNQGPKGSEK